MHNIFCDTHCMSTDEEIGKRLTEARKAAGFANASEAAKSLGMKYPTYAGHENGTRGIGRAAEKYARRYGVSLDWLLRGIGDGPKMPAPKTNDVGGQKPFISSYDPDQQELDGFAEEYAGYSREFWTPKIPGALPEIDVRPGAGEGTVGNIINLPIGSEQYVGHEVLNEWLLPNQFIRHEVKASPNNTLVMEVIGDSMQPTYMPGDRVLVDLSQNKLTVDTVFVISIDDDEPQIKRLQRVPATEPRMVRIISDNTSLETDVIELAQVTIVGRVCGHIARK